MAPIACMPPILNILLTPAVLAAARIAGLMLPSGDGGVQRIISLHPAILAGVASIRTVEKSGAVPPGMYSPTFSIATLFCQHSTPLHVSTLFVMYCCDSWNLSMLPWAMLIASASSLSMSLHALSISSSVTASDSSLAWSNIASYSVTALSPLTLMSSNTL